MHLTLRVTPSRRNVTKNRTRYIVMFLNLDLYIDIQVGEQSV